MSNEIVVELKQANVVGIIAVSGPQGEPGGAYTHPETHPVSMIIPDDNKTFLTASEKASVLKIVASSNFVFTQTVASDVWTVVHNLDKKPAVTVVDTADTVVIGEITYLDNNTVELRFNGQFSGRAYFN